MAYTALHGRIVSVYSFHAGRQFMASSHLASILQGSRREPDLGSRLLLSAEPPCFPLGFKG